jgi:Amt family ammonium transporter
MPTIDSGDVAWLLTSTGLVLIMFPGLALFYGGLVRTKNVLSTFMHTFVALGVVTLVWALYGYSLAFAPDTGLGLIGGLDHVFLRGVTLEPRENTTVPHLLFMLYQMMFAAITPALISGAFAERVGFKAFLAFTVLWTTLVYAPLAHWVWGPGGWLAAAGALDFAGGIVVHISSGVSALVFALVIGARLGYPREKPVPHNLTMTMLGAGLLWFGWFGFNGGSALGANGTAALAIVNSQLAAAAGAVVWMAIDFWRWGKATSLGFASGFVAGLATVTATAGFVSPMSAMLVGVAAGFVCYGGVMLKDRLGYDDSLDAFGVHGVGGVTGSLLLGVFAEKAWNAGGADGIIAGSSKLLGAQLLAVGVAVAYSVVVTFGLVKLCGWVFGLRVQAEAEWDGLDVSLHGEAGYALGTAIGGHSVPAAEEAPAPVLETARGV